MCERLFRYIDDTRFIRFVQEFVQIDSVYDPSRLHANESRVTNVLSSFLKEERFDVHVEEVAPGRSNVIAVPRDIRPERRCSPRDIRTSFRSEILKDGDMTRSADEAVLRTFWEE